jgi:hypothetical protein
MDAHKTRHGAGKVLEELLSRQKAHWQYPLSQRLALGASVTAKPHS